jgi:hypothetical protein
MLGLHRSAGKRLEERNVAGDVYTQVEGMDWCRRSYAAASRRMTAGDDAQPVSHRQSCQPRRT